MPPSRFSSQRPISAVDTVMAGDVLRVVTGGIPVLEGRTPLEALQELRAEHDDFRRFLIEPPRGHVDINACVLLPPFSDEAARTLVVASHFGYAPVAGTMLMAAATVLAESGDVTADGAQTRVVFDTAKGPAAVTVTDSERGRSARWNTARPRVVAREHPFSVGDGLTVPGSVVFSGLPYVVARAADLGVAFDDHAQLGAAGAALSRAAGRALPLQEVGTAEDVSNYLVMVVGEIDRAGGSRHDRGQIQVAWVSSNGTVAPSPAGTGALAVAAHFSATGELAPGAALETIAPGGRFRCWIDADGASVEAPVQIISFLELLADPLDPRR